MDLKQKRVLVTGACGTVGKELVSQLAVDLALAREGERLRYGIVAYRDRGDEFVTRRYPLTRDIDAVVKWIGEIRADGGGLIDAGDPDTPGDATRASCIEITDSSQATVDSAPWFWFGPTDVRASRHPPVAGSASGA